jgi:ATP/maltotriose-dependent transcriptional regulator MalT
VRIYRHNYEAGHQTADEEVTSHNNLSYALFVSGALRSSESTVLKTLRGARGLQNDFEEGTSLCCIGLALAVRGKMGNAEFALGRAMKIWRSTMERMEMGVTSAFQAELALWIGDSVAARQRANQAWELASHRRHEADYIRAARLQGTAALSTGDPNDIETASERLHHALSRARACNLYEQELPALAALAELHRRRGEPERAREVLDDVWEAAERGPYPLFHADALNVLARIERDAGHRDRAVEAATEAYRKAWCDGPPFAYHWGLRDARAILAELEAPEPELPPFDESEFEPMPKVKINLRDKFFVEDGDA